MEARLDYYSNPVAAKFAKHINAAGRSLAGAELPKGLPNLVLIRASQINGCGVCLDMHTKDAAHEGETPVRLAMVAAWREATVFTEAERAALALTEAGTRLADGEGVRDDIWVGARKHFDDDQLIALVSTIALINAYNRMNAITQTPAGSYEPGQWG
ncbi:carboxymuconolactone decarboxylase family protein [Glycomyces algeriensis]|uniref:Alkyl hydroperoxide reductase AhpD n=1 Tax=Glycomyces algeriensis TaxID=256037 RepID=A0A9W6G4V6_9ACTN|nr:carboxymuconolactone decarboxylase family protein [Glycomyces algeriensis]MDA1367222.1 carboxymuconolactone decarboxylase family protein [Glycomyces algeriensis]MDR7353394.1 AhpD family alkylhydroperoxidase [Glycomyces algeriensis]GLI41089.1 alkyl hydroperoxide reductase AhpD [Glycomyces algeriensis]